MAEETKWTHRVIIPLLSELGYINVTYTGGAAEMGRDVVFADYSKLGVLKYYAAQLKDGSVNASRKTAQLTELVEQCRIAFETPYIDLSGGREYRISGVYCIISGRFSDYARAYLKNHTGQWLYLIDGDQLDRAKNLTIRAPNQERGYRLELFHIELNLLLSWIKRARIDPNHTGVHNVYASHCPTVALEQLVYVMMPVLASGDRTVLLTLLHMMYAFNLQLARLPLSEDREVLRPAVAAYNNAVERVKEAAQDAEIVLQHVYESEREAWDRYSVSPAGLKYEETDLDDDAG